MNKRYSFKNILLAITVSVAAVFAPTVLDAAGEEREAAKALPLLKANGCHACHSVDKNLIGPPYRAVAAMHAANKDVVREVLVQKIINGGGSNWGLVPMVPNEHVTEEEARKMVDWIFRLESSSPGRLYRSQ